MLPTALALVQSHVWRCLSGLELNTREQASLTGRQTATGAGVEECREPWGDSWPWSPGGDTTEARSCCTQHLDHDILDKPKSSQAHQLGF